MALCTQHALVVGIRAAACACARLEDIKTSFETVGAGSNRQMAGDVCLIHFATPRVFGSMQFHGGHCTTPVTDDAALRHMAHAAEQVSQHPLIH